MSTVTLDRPARPARPAAGADAGDDAGDGGSVDPAAMPLERVEAEICTLAGQIAAATSRFLTLLADFDARDGWAGWGVHSCAHWLSWRCGLSLHTAHEHVRVATPETEADLLHAALHNPASYVDRLLRGLRTAQRNNNGNGNGNGGGAGGGDGGGAGGGSTRRVGVRWRWEDDGCLKVWGRLSAEDGARLLAGLTRIDEQRRRTAADDQPDQADQPEGTDGGADDGQACGQVGPAGPSYPQPAAAEATGTAGAAVTPAATDTAAAATSATADDEAAAEARAAADVGVAGVPPSDLAPALAAAGQLLCTQVQAPVFAPAADVLVHVDAETLTRVAQHAQADTDAAEDAAATGTPPRLDDGPPLRDGVLAMLACDGRLQLSVHGPDGRTLDLGRKRRRPTRSQLDALWRRDRGCAHPGCGRTRFLHAHHVQAWAAGGRTDLDNLTLLCGEHHRALHDGQFAIVALGKQQFAFHGPRGAERPQAPKTRGDLTALTGSYTHIKPGTIEPDWDGTPLDLPHATDVFLRHWAKAMEAQKSAATEKDGTETDATLN